MKRLYFSDKQLLSLGIHRKLPQRRQPPPERESSGTGLSGGLLFDCLRHSQQECTDEEGIRKNFPAINRIEVDILPNIIYNLR